MSLINCPECKTEVSDQAGNCPKCGFPLKTDPSSKPSNKNPLSIKKLIIGIIPILLIIAAWYGYTNYQSQKAQQLAVEAAKKAQQQPVTLYDEEDLLNESQQPLEKAFDLSRTSNVKVQLLVNGTYTVNVVVLDNDNYGKYETSGSLTNLLEISALSKEDTLGYSAQANLNPGKYVFLISFYKKSILIPSKAKIGFRLIKQGL